MRTVAELRHHARFPELGRAENDEENAMDEVSYGKDDRLDGLSVEQWELLANTQGDLLLSYLENRTVFDVHRVRLMLDLAVVEAKRRVVFLRSGARKSAGVCEIRTDEGSGAEVSLPQNATRRDTAESVLKEILETETARQIFLKMKEGQGTETEEGKVWLKARDVLCPDREDSVS